MKQLKIIKQSNANLSLDNFEDKIIANIAFPYSKNVDELSELYHFGIIKKQEIKNKFDSKYFQRFGMWNLRQHIIKYAQENFNL